MQSIGERTPLDIGKALENMENFLLTAKLVVHHNISKYFENKDVRLLAESMLLSREIPEWEKFCQERSNGRRGTATSLSETLLELVDGLDADPDLSMASITGSEEHNLYSDEDMDMDGNNWHVFPNPTMIH